MALNTRRHETMTHTVRPVRGREATRAEPGAREEGSLPAAGDAGFSIVELLIAAALVLFVVMGIVPLFAQSMASNLSGQNSTEVANAARSRIEEFLQLPFESPMLEIQDGFERELDEYFSSQRERWVDGTLDDLEAGDAALLTRRTRIRQFQSIDLDQPLEAGARPELIHIKEIQVRVASTREGILSAGARFTTRVYKAR
jgi:type II secretory pathway pseudopilin PulG